VNSIPVVLQVPNLATTDVDAVCTDCQFSVNSSAFATTYKKLKAGDVIVIQVNTSGVAEEVKKVTLNFQYNSASHPWYFSVRNKSSVCDTSDKRTFITHSQYSGNLGGIAGADSICQKTADQAGLGGTWKSFLGDGSPVASAYDRMSANGKYCSLDRSSLMIQGRTFHGAYLIDITGFALNGGRYDDAKFLPQIPQDEITYWFGGSDYNCSKWTNEDARVANSTPGTMPQSWGRDSELSYAHEVWKWFQLQDGGAGADICTTKKRLVCFEQ